MEISLQLETYQKEKKSSELLVNLQSLLERAKAEHDLFNAIKILLFEIESMRFLRMHQEAISLLDEELEAEFFQTKEDRIQLLDQLIKTLLQTEDFIKLESVLRQRERYLTSEHQKVMQKFYYAVCYEGMKEYKKAIASLKSIKDNISSSNLINKYLKLSMLYLKEDNLPLAKQNYQHAIRFDANRKNPIFYLAESDIQFYMKDFQNALDTYQEYFIKSKNKRRYLDRYILINIELNRLDEAWRFYKEYQETMSKIISRNYRLVFYEAALKLAKLLNNKLEIELLEYNIETLRPTPPKLPQFDSVYRFLTLAFQPKHFLKAREVIHHIFQAMATIYNFQKLLFVTKEKDRIILYHYSKGLLLEKDVNFLLLNGTVLEPIINSHPTNELYTYEDIIQYQQSIYKTVDTMYVFANGVSRERKFDYFVAYSQEKEQFDTQQKLVLLASEVLQKLLRDFDESHRITETMEQYEALLARQNGGFIKIEQNMIHFLNQQAKLLLEVESDYLAFEEFQTRLTEKIYLDDFLYTKEIVLHLKSNDKAIHFDIQTNELVIYAYMKQYESIDSSSSNPLLDMVDERQMLVDNQSTDSKTVFMVDIRNYRDYLKDYNHLNYKKKLELLSGFMNRTAKQHFDQLYFSGFNVFFLVIQNTDKRVTKRISESIVKEYKELDVRVSLVQFNHSLHFEKILQLQYLNALTTEEKPVIYDNKNVRYNQELSKTILININNFLKKKYIPLSFVSYQDWKDNQMCMLQVSISQHAMLGEENSLQRVLRSADLEEEWDYLLASSLVSDIKQYHLPYRFVLPLATATLFNPKQLKRMTRKIKDYPIVLRINCQDLHHLDMLESLKDSEVALMGYDFVSKINVRDVANLTHFDYLTLPIDQWNSPYLNDFLNLLPNQDTKLILDHKNSTLKKSLLERYHIRYVIGQFSTKYGSVNALKK